MQEGHVLPQTYFLEEAQGDHSKRLCLVESELASQTPGPAAWLQVSGGSWTLW